MKVVLLCVCVVGLACQALAARYHERVGIPMAKEIGLRESMRVAGGLASYKGEHPFFAGLIITLKTGITSVCGGTMLSHYHVVTIGQCWYDGENEGREIQVVLGSVTLFTGGTRKYAETVNLHPAFDPSTLTNDIAMIVIPYVSYSSYIKPIVLPEAYFSSLAGYKAEIIGFGRTSPDAALGLNSSLNDVYVTVMNNTECNQIYGELVTYDIMCTSGANGKGACAGDYGGPLVLRRFIGASGEDMLVGLVSFTAALGCDAGLPTGYTRITSHLRWIKRFL